MKNSFGFITVLFLVLLLIAVYVVNVCKVEAGVKMVNPKEAKKIALKVSGGGDIERFRFKGKLDEANYFFTINRGDVSHIIDINAFDGGVLKYETKILLYDKTAKECAEKNKISRTEAEKAAREVFGKGYVVKAKYVFDARKGPRYNVIIVDGDERHDFDIYHDVAKVKFHTPKTVVKRFIGLESDMITPEKAQVIARKMMAGMVVKCKLYHEEKHDVDAYKIDIIKDDVRYSYKVSAYEGEVIETNINYLYNKV